MAQTPISNLPGTVGVAGAKIPLHIHVVDSLGNVVDTFGSTGGGGAVTIADGAAVALGTTTDAAITTSIAGTVIGYLRGLVLRLLAQVLDYDTGAGTASQVLFGMALPGSGGPVAGGTATNPIVTAMGGLPATLWAVHHVPAANTQATITQASAGGSLRNACLGLTVTLASSSTTAPAAIQLTVALIDGATGGGTYLWRSVISLPAVAGAIVSINRSFPNGIHGTAATAMTLEFSVAGGANTIESVSMHGITRL